MLTLDAIFVINVGEMVPVALREYWSSRNATNLHWIHRSHDTSSFETLSIRHLHNFAQFLTLERSRSRHWSAPQLLYLHTKGVSYRNVDNTDGTNSLDYINDWRRMMLYFLVEKHESCFHLLRSGEFDTLGSNYISSGHHRFYSGNMWWADAGFIARLASLDPLAPKYAAEHWLLGSSERSRAYVLHSSEVIHALELYPRSRYVPAATDAGDMPRAKVGAEVGVRPRSAFCVGMHLVGAPLTENPTQYILNLYGGPTTLQQMQMERAQNRHD